jgi:hypothetical protein
LIIALPALLESAALPIYIQKLLAFILSLGVCDKIARMDGVVIAVKEI